MEQEPAQGTREFAPHNYITQYQLHKEFGIGKATINRAVKAGKLELHDRPDGRARVFVPQAINVFKDLIKNDAELVETTSQRNENTLRGTSAEITKLTLELALAKQEIAHKEEIIQRIEAHKTDIERERDRLIDEVKALPAPPPANDLPAVIDHAAIPPEIKLNRLQAFAAIFTGKVKVGANG